MPKRTPARRPRPKNGQARSAKKPVGSPKRAAPRPPAPVPSVLAAVRPAPPASAALAEFEAAVRSLQEHDYRGAAARFRALIDSFPAERALLDRARVYLELCERELRKRPAAARTLEEQVTFATAALNDGNDSSAERLAAQVLDQSPDHDLALYILAAVRARKGDRSAALDFLRRAVRVSPDVSAQARHDADFEPLRHSPEFQALIDVQGRNGHQSDSRRPRRSRTDG